MSEKMFCPPQPLRFWITPACAGKSRRKTTDRFCSRDHPRVCGEKWEKGGRSHEQQGSPPRMRGKEDSRENPRFGVRITPACAGKSRSQPRLPCTGRDHPRLCGEKSPPIGGSRFKPGSPPHVRGKDTAVQREPFLAGITPAYAGKRWGRCAGTGADRDHPRVCGEKSKMPSRHVDS